MVATTATALKLSLVLSLCCRSLSVVRSFVRSVARSCVSDSRELRSVEIQTSKRAHSSPEESSQSLNSSLILSLASDEITSNRNESSNRIEYTLTPTPTHTHTHTMIQDKMVRARRQYHHHHNNNHHRHALNHFYRHNKRSQVPSAPSNTTQFIMNDHESIEPDFDLMHNAIMEHYNRNKKRKHQHATSNPNAATETTTTTQSINLSPSTRNQQPQPLQPQESTKSNPTTPSHRPNNGSPGDEDGMSPFINHEHLQSEFQEVYANIHTERLSSMSKNQLVNQYLLLEERVEELENQLRESQTSASHG